MERSKVKPCKRTRSLFFCYVTCVLDSQRSQCAARKDLYNIFIYIFVSGGRIKTISIIINCLQSELYETRRERELKSKRKITIHSFSLEYMYID